MAKKSKLPKTIKYGTRCRVRVNRRNEYGEYVVETFVGKRREGEYFASDVADARGTAAASIKWLRKHRRKACLGV